MPIAASWQKRSAWLQSERGGLDACRLKARDNDNTSTAAHA
jgi:hypothetical protein